MTHMIPAWKDDTLTPVEKIEVHRAGLRHKAVSVFVMDGERVLVQRRALGKYHTPGLWANTCCTHPHWGETAAECAVRRLREELGITDVYPALRETVEYRADVGSGMVEHEVVDIFIANVSGDLKITPDPDEVMEVRWVDLFDLAAEVERRPEQFTPWLRIYLRDHKETIFGTIVRT
jgi:isopentenyl-diphosphate delta-isomerase